VIVIGGGGHAKVVIDTLLAGGATVAGLCDPALTAGDMGPLGIPVLGGDAALDAHPPADFVLANGIGSTGSTARRREVFERAKAKGYVFATVVHPSAVIGRDVRLEEGAQVMAGAVVQPGAVLGRNCLVNTRASVDHDCKVGEHAHIAPGVVLCGGVHVGAGAHVGSGATVVQDMRLGEVSLVCAGTVTTVAVPDGATVRGPSASVRRRGDGGVP
jgi:UDP-perosamine 4-acetyltransferase